MPLTFETPTTHRIGTEPFVPFGLEFPKRSEEPHREVAHRPAGHVDTASDLSPLASGCDVTADRAKAALDLVRGDVAHALVEQRAEVIGRGPIHPLGLWP